MTSNQQPLSTYEAAVQYHQRGIMPIPIPRGGQSQGKAPCMKGWQQLRPTSADLPNLFPKNQALNIGVLLGEPSNGLIDIDLDAMEAVHAARWFLPQTGWVSGRASKPASHWWYRVDHPPKKASTKFTAVDQAGLCLVELRSTSGQTVVPPSIHPSGEQVRWERFTEPAQVPLAELFQAVGRVAACALLARIWPAAGTRQDAFMALIGGLARSSWSAEEITCFIDALCNATTDDEPAKRQSLIASTMAKCQQGQAATGWPRLAQLLGEHGAKGVQLVQQWLQTEFWVILGNSGRGTNSQQNPMISRGFLNSGYCGHSGRELNAGATNAGSYTQVESYGASADESDQWPEPIIPTDDLGVPSFPEGIFPKPLEQLMEELSFVMNAPRDYVGLAMLAIAAGAIGNASRLQLTSSQGQPALIYGAMVGLPGTTKSPVLKHLVGALDQIQKQFNTSYAVEKRRWDGLPKEDRGEKPILKTCLVRNITTESLTLVLQENPRGVLMPMDELSSLFLGFGQYKGGAGNDRQFYLSVWAQETVDVRRKSDLLQGVIPAFVPNPCVSIIGGLPPDLLTTIRGSNGRQPALDDGGIDRFLYVWPPVLPDVEEQWRDLTPEAKTIWNRVMERLVHQIPEEGETVRLNIASKHTWRLFTQGHAAEVNDPDFVQTLRGPWQKLKAYTARLALVLHWLDWACHGGERCTELSEDVLNRAVRLIGYFKTHTRKVHAAAGQDTRTEGVKRLCHWIKKNQMEQFVKRDAYHALRAYFPTIDQFEPVLALAERHHLIRPGTMPDRTGPGRKPSPWYEVNPGFFRRTDAQNTHNTQNSNEPPDGGSEIEAFDSTQPTVNQVFMEEMTQGETGRPSGSDPPKSVTTQNCPEFNMGAQNSSGAGENGGEGALGRQAFEVDWQRLRTEVNRHRRQPTEQQRSLQLLQDCRQMAEQGEMTKAQEELKRLSIVIPQLFQLINMR